MLSSLPRSSQVFNSPSKISKIAFMITSRLFIALLILQRLLLFIDDGHEQALSIDDLEVSSPPSLVPLLFNNQVIHTSSTMPSSSIVSSIDLQWNFSKVKPLQ